MNLRKNQDQYKLDLMNPEELKDFREWLEKTYHESSEKNISLHVVAENSCYPAEINEKHGSLKDCLDEIFKDFLDPEDPAYEIDVLNKEIEEIWDEGLIFRTKEGKSNYEKGLRKLFAKTAPERDN